MISFVILTFNSQKYLKDVLSSISFANEIIVVDSGSSDNTKMIVKEFKNAKFIHQKWLGFSDQKQFGVNLAKNEWVFVLDSDEIFTKELELEIKDILKDPKFYAYKVPRLNNFFGKFIKTMGLYPDYSIRLFNKNFAHFNGARIHESVVLNDKDKKIAKLKNHFIHYAYEDTNQFIQKQLLYANLGKKPNKFKAIFNPFWTFFKMYILKGGFKEGFDGFVIAKIYAQYTFWKYIK